MPSRRQFLSLTASASITALAGCTGLFDEETTPNTSTPTQTPEQTIPLYDIPDELQDRGIKAGDGKHPYIGNPDADKVVHYFTDVQCPFCYQWDNDVLPKLYEKYIKPGKVGLYIRPVGTLGGQSNKFATTAYELMQYGVTQGDWLLWWLNASSAAEKGKTVASTDYLRSSFSEIGVSETGINKIMADVNSYESYPASVIDNNEQLASVYDMSGTPFFIGVNADQSVINSGISLSGAHPIGAFERMFQNLEEKKSSSGK